MRTTDQTAPPLAFRRRIPPGWWVVAALLVLMHGPQGVLPALGQLVYQFAAGVLGGEGVVRGVLIQAAPLVVVSAVISYGVAAGWVTKNYFSLLAAAVVLAISGPIGVEARKLVEPPTEPVAPALAASPAGSGPLQPEPNEITAWEAARRLASWDTLAAAPADRPRDEDAPKVRLFPESAQPTGVARLWTAAVEQTLGYLLVYRPRLFAAALLAGAYLGWRWHRHVATLKSIVLQPRKPTISPTNEADVSRNHAA